MGDPSERVLSAATRLLAEIDIERLSARVCEEARKLTDSDEAYLRFEPDGGSLVRWHVSPQGESTRSPSYAATVASRLVGSAEPVLFTSDDFDDRDALWGLIAIPLAHVRGRMQGYLFVTGRRVGEYTDDDLAALRGLTPFAWSALQNAAQHRDAIIAQDRFSVLGQGKTVALNDWIVHTNESWWSSGVTSLLGYPDEEMGQEDNTLFNLVHPDDHDRFVGHILSAMSSEDDEATFTYRVRRADGTYADISDHRHFIRDATGRAVRVVGVFTDVSEQLRVEALRVEKEAAEAATASRTLFLASVSHEIRSPLTAILGNAQLLQRTDLDADQQHLAEVVHTSAQHMRTIINDLLDLTKIESGRFEFENRPFSLPGLVRSSFDLVEHRSKEKGISLSYEIEPDVPDQVMGDEGRVRQVLVNLIANSVKFTDEGGVRVRVLSSGSGANSGITFEVHDTGIGMDDETIAKVFKPYAQADPSVARRYGGTGLGLSISQQLVDAMGGAIWVTGELGVGSVFAFALPLRRVDA